MGCDVLGTDLSNPTARAEMNAGDLVQIHNNDTGDTDQTTVGDFLSNGKFDKYGSPEDRLKILQGGTWKNAQGTPYKSSLPIASGFERYRDQLMGAYQVRETVKKAASDAAAANAANEAKAERLAKPENIFDSVSQQIDCISSGGDIAKAKEAIAKAEGAGLSQDRLDLLRYRLAKKLIDIVSKTNTNVGCFEVEQAILDCERQPGFGGTQSLWRAFYHRCAQNAWKAFHSGGSTGDSLENPQYRLAVARRAGLSMNEFVVSECNAYKFAKYLTKRDGGDLSLEPVLKGTVSDESEYDREAGKYERTIIYEDTAGEHQLSVAMDGEIIKETVD